MVFAFSAYLGSFKIRQYQAQKEIKHLIKAGAPDSLHFDFYLDELEANPSQMTWIHSKEFRYKGEMYDILDRHEVDGRVLLHCIHDVKESGLFAELDRMVDLNMQQDPQQKQHQKQLFKLLQSLFLPLSDEDLWALLKSYTLHKTRYRFSEGHNFSVPSTPPPQRLI